MAQGPLERCMKGVFRAPTPPPTEAEIGLRRASPPQDISQLLHKVAFPASRDDLLHSLMGFKILVSEGEVDGEQVARRLKERVYRSREQLEREVLGTQG